MQNTTFSPINSLTKFLIGLFYAGIVLDLVNIFLNFVIFNYFPNIGESESFNNEDVIIGLVSLAFITLYLLVTLGLIILFLVWLHRAYKNLYAFEIKELKSSPGLAVGWWFIPLANLFMPLKVVNEIFHASDPENMDTEFFYADNSSPSLHIFWWIAWIISGIFSNISTRASFSSSELSSFEVNTTIIASGFSIVAAFLVIQIIKNINQRQIASYNKMKIKEPPMPPNFNEQVGQFNFGDER